MDLAEGKKQLINYIKRYQYILVVLAVGICLMLLPQREAQPIQHSGEETIPVDLEQKLTEILSQIKGVGKAEVLLTEENGSNTIYQTDAGQNYSNLDTVIITDGNREERGLVKQVLPPEYRGALIVCQGADSAGVRLSVVEAVKSVTGLSSDCITVLKMK